MQFTPALFQKFGSSADDLLKKKLESEEKHQLIVQSQSKGIHATHTVNTVGGSLGQLEGKIQIKYEDKAYGEGSVDLFTSGKLQTDLKLTKLAAGLIMTSRLESNVKCNEINPQAAFQYKQDAFAGHVEYIHKQKEFLASGAIGYEGFSVGALVKTDINKLQNGAEPIQALSIDGGLQYEEKNITGTFTIASSNAIALSLFHNMNKQTQFAGKLVATSNKGNSIAFVGQHVLSPSTMLKGKIHLADDKSFALASHFEHTVASPDLTVGVTAFYDSKKQTPAFGVSATFGAH